MKMMYSEVGPPIIVTNDLMNIEYLMITIKNINNNFQQPQNLI